MSNLRDLHCSFYNLKFDIITCGHQNAVIIRPQARNCHFPFSMLHLWQEMRVSAQMNLTCSMCNSQWIYLHKKSLDATHFINTLCFSLQKIVGFSIYCTDLSSSAYSYTILKLIWRYLFSRTVKTLSLRWNFYTTIHFRADSLLFLHLLQAETFKL